MADGEIPRRLAAILAADVAGYSHLVGEDEEGTLSALRTHRAELIDPKIAEHRGRIANTAGDSLLVEFPSVVDALRCAVDVQCGMRERNAALPDRRRMAFRMGINIGEVIPEGEDIHGEGVIVAARLEGLSEPGGICVRRNVRNQIRDRLDLNFEDLGEIEVKNIARPVRAFRVLLDEKAAALATPVARTAIRTSRRSLVMAAAAGGLSLLAAAAVVGGLFWPGKEPPPSDEKPSIAVLPFVNISDDPEQEYFVDGMTEDLITDLSKVSGLLVIARNSVFSYKGRAVNVQQAGKDLGVRYVLEGSVRRSDGRVRINAQLIDTESGHHLWAERYDGQDKDIWALQDKVRERIVSALSVKLTQAEQTRLARPPTDNLKAYDYYLHAEQHYYSGGESSLRESLRAYEAAIALDPNFAQAYAHYARAAVDIWRFDYIQVMPGPLARKLAKDKANKSLALDPNVTDAYYVLALLQLVEGAHANAVEAARHAVYIDPNNAEAYLVLGVVLGYAGRHAEALDAVKTALRLNPKPPHNLLRYYGWVLVMNRQFDQAIEVLEKIPSDSRGVFSIGDSPGELLAMAYALAGRADEAREQIAGMLKQHVWANVSYFALLYRHHKRAEDLEFRLDALRRAGLPEWPFGYQGSPENRLDEQELKGITAQGTWTGWDTSRNLSFVRETYADGTVVYANAETLMSGSAHVQDGMLCVRYDIFAMGRDQCGYVYRNPEGTAEDANEFTYVIPTTILRFSIKK